MRWSHWPQWSFTVASYIAGEKTESSAYSKGVIPKGTRDLQGRSPGEGNGNPLQYPCLESLMERGTWWTAVHGVTKVGHD